MQYLRKVKQPRVAHMSEQRAAHACKKEKKKGIQQGMLCLILKIAKRNRMPLYDWLISDIDQ